MYLIPIFSIVTHPRLSTYCRSTFLKIMSLGLPGDTVGKNSPANAGDMGSILDARKFHMPRSN